MFVSSYGILTCYIPNWDTICVKKSSSLIFNFSDTVEDRILCTAAV